MLRRVPFATELSSLADAKTVPRRAVRLSAYARTSAKSTVGL